MNWATLAVSQHWGVVFLYNFSRTTSQQSDGEEERAWCVWGVRCSAVLNMKHAVKRMEIISKSKKKAGRKEGERPEGCLEETRTG